MVSQSHDDKMCSATGAPELSSVKALATARPLRRRRAGPAVPSDAWARGGESEADVPGATPWGLDLGAPLQDWELTELAQRVRFNGALFGFFLTCPNPRCCRCRRRWGEATRAGSTIASPPRWTCWRSGRVGPRRACASRAWLCHPSSRSTCLTEELVLACLGSQRSNSVTDCEATMSCEHSDTARHGVIRH
mmetsp:Transcript_15741/g.54850  ORF Transcript_15741/g.54850 Transcript_15741/m.54850 type:complete len:192 (-) Transcript_15741:191-766(-)